MLFSGGSSKLNAKRGINNRLRIFINYERTIREPLIVLIVSLRLNFCMIMGLSLSNRLVYKLN
jgi:hypothetical protein